MNRAFTTLFPLSLCGVALSRSSGWTTAWTKSSARTRSSAWTTAWSRFEAGALDSQGFHLQESAASRTAPDYRARRVLQNHGAGRFLCGTAVLNDPLIGPAHEAATTRLDVASQHSPRKGAFRDADSSTFTFTLSKAAHYRHRWPSRAFV